MEDDIFNDKEFYSKEEFEARHDALIARHDAHVDMQDVFEWDRFFATIPAISFPAGWKISIIPPYFGAIVRFIAHFKGKEISVYLDGFNMLGIFELKAGGFVPYWEAYPIKEDTFRCHMKDVDGLIKAMKQEFERIEEGKQ